MKSQTALLLAVVASPALLLTHASAQSSLAASATVSAPISVAAAPATEEYGPYKPYGSAAVTLHTHDVDPDAGIVTDIPRIPNQLAAGTALRIRIHDDISTDSTESNTPFTAELAESVISEGRVVLPAGSTVEGTITQVRGGRRIRGSALIHLQPQTVILPDGQRMHIRASVIDSDQFANTRVDDEGNIVRRDHVGATLAAMSLTTGSAAAAGAVFGGGVGALVGAGVGAGLSTAWWLKQDRQTHIPKDSVIVLALQEPLSFGAPHSSDPSFSQTPKILEMPSAATSNIKATDIPPAPYVEPQAFVPTN